MFFMPGEEHVKFELFSRWEPMPMDGTEKSFVVNSNVARVMEVAAEAAEPMFFVAKIEVNGTPTKTGVDADMLGT
jgi:hypothetical protein